MSWTQQELAEMYADAVRAKNDVLRIQHLGGDPSELLNEIFDAHVVFGMWRKKRGGIGYLPVKGTDYLIRISETGQAERLRLAKYDFGDADTAEAVARYYDAYPNARWQQAFVDGKPSGFALAAG